MYKIVRSYYNGRHCTIMSGLTLEDAQAYCKDPETSSKTCTLPVKKAITRRCGEWFDGYEEM